MPRGRPAKNSLAVDNNLQDLLQIWNQALTEPNGIKIHSLKPNRLAQLLYWARRECGHTTYHSLKVIEDETMVWIVPR